MSEEIINTEPITDKRTDAVFPNYTFKDVYAMYDGSIYINKIRRDCIVLTIKNESYELVKSVLDNDRLSLFSTYINLKISNIILSYFLSASLPVP